MSVDKKNIEQIIQLLDDQDEGVYTILKEQLLGYGPEILPILDETIDNCFSKLVLSRLKEVFDTLNLENVIQEFKKWKNSEDHNLFEAMIILSKFKYPKLDVEVVNHTLSKIKQDVWLEVNDNMTALERIRVMNHVFFDLHGFHGNTQDFIAPENSFINDVLSKKKGNPITLSIIYSLIAQGVNIPVYGVNMPRQFILAYVEKIFTEPSNTVKPSEVLFYINPFNRGDIYSSNEVRQFLLALKIEPKDSILMPCSHIDIVKRCLTNLVNSYRALNENLISEKYAQILESFDED
jgi:regulator of sirC expression with transglutaminase-like and TPR domain